MIFRVLSGVFAVLAFWAAYLQLNDPDPERWFAMYAAAGVVGVLFAAGKPRMEPALLVGIIALAWAGAIVPELAGRWQPSDLGAKMAPDRPEVEFGRELGGLTIVAAYCLGAFFVARKSKVARAT